jgi:hypothetical protein
MKGKSGNLLDPQGTATRAQTAQLMMSYLKSVG